MIRRKPHRRLQALRGARLALQHFKDWSGPWDLGDAEHIDRLHLSEFRKLAWAGRRAYNRWKPSGELIERLEAA